MCLNLPRIVLIADHPYIRFECPKQEGMLALKHDRLMS